MEQYFNEVQHVLTQIITTQRNGISEAVSLCAKAIAAKRAVFLFGTGHSHMLAEELYYRAGGLLPIVPILETGLMLHEGAVKSTKLERLSGYADILLEESGIGHGDILIVISNSGINALPVEMALGARNLGVTVIALTSIAHSSHSESRHASGQRLYEAADLVLDNCGTMGDAAVQLENFPSPVGPTSTIAGAFILNSIVVEVCSNLLAAGIVPPVYLSANVPGGSGHNDRLIAEMRQAGYRLRL